MELKLLWIFILYFLMNLVCLISSEHVLQYVEDVIGAENYTYYKLNRAGRLRLTLQSQTGDADLYLSDTLTNPTFEDYVLDAVSCGLDEVIVPASYKRPVTIGVYGHPTAEQSKYKLTISYISDNDDETYTQFVNTFYNYAQAVREDNERYMSPEERRASQARFPAADKSSGEFDEDEGSVLWQIFLFIVKLFFEVIF